MLTDVKMWCDVVWNAWVRRMDVKLFCGKNSESRAAQGTRRAVTRREGVNGRVNAKNYKTSAAVMSDKPVAPHYDSTPVTAESFKHLEMPADLMKEAIAFRKEVQELDDSHQRLAMVDTIQTLAAQVGLLQKAAAHLKKDIRDVTALDAATYRLHEHEQFVSSVQLDKVVLFSHKQTLDNFRTGVKTITARYAGGQLPADLKKQLETAEATLATLAANEEIVEVPVSEELYQHAQSNLFPSLSKKVRTPLFFLHTIPLSQLPPKQLGNFRNKKFGLQKVQSSNPVLGLHFFFTQQTLKLLQIELRKQNPIDKFVPLDFEGSKFFHGTPSLSSVSLMNNELPPNNN